MASKTLTMSRFQKIEVPCRVSGGKLLLDRKILEGKVSGALDNDRLTLTIEEKVKPKTWEQIKAFHGPILDQIQKHYEDTEGVYLSKDRIKHDLKQRFLVPVKKFFSDGSPVMVRVKHPERDVYFETQYSEIPSLSDISIDEARGFINTIIDHFLHVENLAISIDENLKPIK